jgi:hypothetical protein
LVAVGRFVAAFAAVKTASSMPEHNYAALRYALGRV